MSFARFTCSEHDYTTIVALKQERTSLCILFQNLQLQITHFYQFLIDFTETIRVT